MELADLLLPWQETEPVRQRRRFAGDSDLSQTGRDRGRDEEVPATGGVIAGERCRICSEFAERVVEQPARLRARLAVDQTKTGLERVRERTHRVGVRSRDDETFAPACESDDLVISRARQLLRDASVNGRRMHRAGFEQPAPGCVVARPPHKAGRRAVPLKWPGQEREGRVASRDHDAGAQSGDRLGGDQRTGDLGPRERRQREGGPEAWDEAGVADEGIRHWSTVDLREEQARRCVRRNGELGIEGWQLGSRAE